MRLHVHQWGRDPRVVLVHGGVLGGRETWRAQRPLTERWTLLAPDRSLTILEPPSTGVVRGVPAVDEVGSAVRASILSNLAPVGALQRFFPIAGVPIEVPDEPHETLVKGVRQLLGSEANEIICDTIARETGARRAVCPGRGHLVQDAPEFNGLLESFLTSSA